MEVPKNSVAPAVFRGFLLRRAIREARRDDEGEREADAQVDQGKRGLRGPGAEDHAEGLRGPEDQEPERDEAPRDREDVPRGAAVLQVRRQDLPRRGGGGGGGGD